jgi:DNA-binding HxlR family transcriptional regulator
LKGNPQIEFSPEWEEKFRRFRDDASAFSKEISSTIPFSNDDPALSAQMNLEISRVIFGKWALDILVLLYSLRALGFEAIRKHLKGISARVLSEKLKRLDDNGLIQKEVQGTRPIRVLYRLTDVGLMSAKLGEPVILYLRYRKGLYLRDLP